MYVLYAKSNVKQSVPDVWKLTPCDVVFTDRRLKQSLRFGSTGLCEIHMNVEY